MELGVVNWISKLITGHVKVWTLDDGGGMTSTRGQILLDTFMELEIVVTNDVEVER